MLSKDETALVCDFAAEYGIFDWRSLPIRTAATLAAGLRYNSRIAQSMAGLRVSIDTLLAASITDRLGMLIRGLSRSEGDPPKQMLPALMGTITDDSEGASESYLTGEDFEAARAALIASMQAPDNALQQEADPQ